MRDVGWKAGVAMARNLCQSSGWVVWHFKALVLEGRKRQEEFKGATAEGKNAVKVQVETQEERGPAGRVNTVCTSQLGLCFTDWFQGNRQQTPLTARHLPNIPPGLTPWLSWC